MTQDLEETPDQPGDPPLRRLRRDRGRRSASPCPPPRPTAESLPARGSSSKKVLKEKCEKRPKEKSEFVHDEAVESDEDEMMGFAGQTRDDDEETGEDLDAILPSLVNDEHMSDDQVAENMIKEKHLYVLGGSFYRDTLLTFMQGANATRR
jgi:hypothetical protein